MIYKFGATIMARTVQIFKKEVGRYPRLDTVLMVEEVVQKAKKRFKRTKKKIFKKRNWRIQRKKSKKSSKKNAKII